jgi:nicotinate-nucleotide--dimethylbenzimidazole phosphoribosyltransferase
MEKIINIKPLDEAAMSAARDKWNNVAKPIGSLGLLEESVIKIAGITGTADVRIDNRCVVVMCADNGVASEGVSYADSSVTEIIANGIASGVSSISRMAQTFGADVIAVDIGMNRDIRDASSDRIVNRKVACGTQNIALGAAMTIPQAQQAINAGIDLVKTLKARGVQIIATGEMGIGNTTTTSALAAVLLNEAVENVTGRGAGLDSGGIERKVEVIKRSIEANGYGQPKETAPIELLSKLGGYDICGMVGLFLGGAIHRVPIIVDGVISAVSALIAARIEPPAKDYMLCSHVSREPAGEKLLKELGMKPLITSELCLGEGTGGVLLLPLLDGALSVYHKAHRFDEIKLEELKL